MVCAGHAVKFAERRMCPMCYGERAESRPRMRGHNIRYERDARFELQYEAPYEDR
jgi:hypothetical protein